MLVRSFIVGLFSAIAMVLGISAPARAALTAQDLPPSLADLNTLEMRQYQISDARLPGQSSTRQTVTAWQVTQGSWNGQQLTGLSLVLVRSVSQDGRALPTANCYVSQSATLAQRDALIRAFLSTQSFLLSRLEISSMRIEPAVITFEMFGTTIVFHLGLLA